MLQTANVHTIALNTFRESIRSKLLYSILFFAVILLLLSFFFGSVTIGDRDRVVLSFGLFAVSFFSVTYAVIAGTAFLHKELARKTIYNILAKPVSRGEFLLGKYAGMLLTSVTLVTLMSTCLIVFLLAIGSPLSPGLAHAFLSICLQLIIVCAYAIFFSAIVVTPLLSGAFTFALFVAGRSSEYILSLTEGDALGTSGEAIIKSIYAILPHLDWLDVSNEVVYSVSISTQHVGWGVLYSLGYATFLLVCATIIFKLREFN